MGWDGESVDVRRADTRAHTATGWLESRHSFSFGPHYDPANTHFGLLLVSNDDVVAAGSGFETHPHRDMEIVTWVLDGSLVHQDSQGNTGVLHPGLAQRMTAGTGILHSEKNDAGRLGGERHGDAHGSDVHFVQMWVAPDTASVAPSYEQLDITRELDSGELVIVASGMPAHHDRRAISLRQEHAALHAARLPAGGSAELPAARYVHLYVARGSVGLETVGALSTGDAARVTDAQGRRVTAGPSGAEILVWEMATRLSV